MRVKPIDIIRVSISMIMLIHGLGRYFLGYITPFNEFLLQFGLPPHSGSIITAFEIIASILLIARVFIVPICLLFIIQLLVGLFMVHLENGWFVVGAGRNGIEFSLLLIVCFCTILLDDHNKIIYLNPRDKKY